VGTIMLVRIQEAACGCNSVSADTRGLRTFRIDQDNINKTHQTPDTTLSLCNGTELLYLT